MQPYGGHYYPQPGHGYPYPYPAGQQSIPVASSSSQAHPTDLPQQAATAPASKKRTRASIASDASTQQSKPRSRGARASNAASGTAGDESVGRQNSKGGAARGSTTLAGDQSDDQLDGDDSDGTGTGPAGKRKKRLPLNCGECVRRKIKCDRQMPCSACVRRKRTQFCSFDDDDPTSPYALNSEVRSINRRLMHLESLFQQAHPQLVHQNQLYPVGGASPGSASASGASIHASPGLPIVPQSFARQAKAEAHTFLPPPPPPPPAPPHQQPRRPASDTAVRSEGQEQSASDTEDAVADLEEQTFGARVPVLRALQDSAQAPVRSYNYVKVPDMELTRCMTSILAEPLSFDQDGRPRSAVRLGLDLAVSTADLPAVRDEALGQVIAVLPDADIASFLIEKYFAELEYDFKVLDPVAFRVEHERFVDMVQQGRQALVDPLWISVFCMVLALALEAFWSRPNGMKDLAIFRGLAESDLRDLPSVWHDAALRALQLGEWGGTPRIRTIQCIILFGQYIQISSSSGQQGRFLGWAASAIRVAQRMSLHRLGSDPQIMPPDDPALPPGQNSLKRQMAVRLWHHLVNIDAWLSDSPAFRCYILHPSQYNTARPLNLNLSDLSRTEWQTPDPLPLNIYTDVSFQLVQCKVAEQIRRALDTLVLSGNKFSYSAVLEQDSAWRQVLDGIPDVYLQPLDSSPRIAYEPACIFEDVYSRIVRLNRPLLGRGYNADSPYAASREKCIEAAKALILTNYDMLRIETSRWWMYTGTLASSIVLMMDIFHAIDHDRPEAEIKENREVLGKARIIFGSDVATPALTVVVEEGRKILAGLLFEEERRRTTKAAHDMAAVPLPPLETFSQVLKRISREVAAQDFVQAGLTPAPSAQTTQPVSQAESVAYDGGEPPFSFARAAATAMAKTPMVDSSVLPHMYEGPATVPDYSSFVNTLVSEDWTAGTFTSPGGDEASLLDQLAATW
ncbi:hypothetical protein JCM10908_006203 [Rhodotorula pacifica]|uniref:uncharacterized protein n=1 Tax=Rhodotorula pacifica TaxID=1495444 RepID=UPI0031746B7B